MGLLQRISILQPHLPPAGTGEVVLTFDDGPNGGGVSARLLDVLRDHDVQATFCQIGRHVEAHPELTRRAHREGHRLALHTHTHRVWPLFWAGRLRRELDLNLAALRAATGEPGLRVGRFRPPYGLKTPAMARVLAERGLGYAHVTFFDSDVAVGEAGAPAVLAAAQQRLEQHGGGALVLHEDVHRALPGWRAPDKAWLPGTVDLLIRWVRARGWRFADYRD